MKTSSIRFRLPAAPTDALPGSEEKIRVLTERARLRVSLWHPLDAKLPTAASEADAHGLADLCLAS
jgi:hypothetical protein